MLFAQGCVNSVCSHFPEKLTSLEKTVLLLLLLKGQRESLNSKLFKKKKSSLWCSRIILERTMQYKKYFEGRIATQ